MRVILQQPSMHGSVDQAMKRLDMVLRMSTTGSRALTGLKFIVVGIQEDDLVNNLIEEIRKNKAYSHIHEDDLIKVFNGDALIEADATLQAQGIENGDFLEVVVTQKGLKRLRDLGELKASYGTIREMEWSYKASEQIKEAISCSDHDMLVEYLNLIECKAPDMLTLHMWRMGYETLMSLALEKNSNECLRVLRDFAKKSKDQELREKLDEGVVLNLVRSGQVKLLQNFVETWDTEKIQSAKDWCKMKFKETLLNSAARRGNIDVMNVLLDPPWSMSFTTPTTPTPTTDGESTVECAFYGINEGEDGKGDRLLECMNFIILYEEAHVTREKNGEHVKLKNDAADALVQKNTQIEALQKILDSENESLDYTRKVELVQSDCQMLNMNTSVGALELLRNAAEHAKETEWGLQAAFCAAMDNLHTRVTGQYAYTAIREWKVERILPIDDLDEEHSRTLCNWFGNQFWKQYIKNEEAADAKWQSITYYEIIKVWYVLEGDKQYCMPFIDLKNRFWVGIEGVPESYAEMFYIKDIMYEWEVRCAKNRDLLKVTDNWLRVFRTDRTS